MARNKNHYQILISIYVNKRERYKERLGSTSEEYLKKRNTINKKLKTWRNLLSRVSKRDEKTKLIYTAVGEFLGNPPETSREGKGIFVKYAMENQLEGAFIGPYIKCTSPKLIYRARLSFTRSFKKYPENKELYHRFKLFMKDKQEVK